MGGNIKQPARVSERQQRSFAAAATYLAGRTAAHDHRRLLDLLRPGLSVLDVGCANGAITRSIADAIAPTGEAIGVDINISLINEAAATYADVPNLTFATADAYLLPCVDEFDIVTAARTLQWCRHPDRVLAQMKKAVKPGGLIVILDYNHEKIAWEPAIPAAVRHFYAAYLQWRREAGFDPATADRLTDLMAAAGLVDIRVTPQHDVAERGDPHFERMLDLWRIVLDKRGDHLVRSGHLRASQFTAAREHYDRWANTFARKISMYALTVEGRRPVD